MSAAPLSSSPKQKDNAPALLLKLECSEAPVNVRKVEILAFLEEWGEHGEKAVKVRLELESSDEQIIPLEYSAAVRDLKEVALRGPTDKSNTVNMSIKHECKRGTYTLRRKKKEPLKFSAIPENPKITVSREQTALKWKTEATIPASRLLDLVAMLIAGDVVVTVEDLQLDMWGD